MDWFLHDNGLRQERVKKRPVEFNELNMNGPQSTHTLLSESVYPPIYFYSFASISCSITDLYLKVANSDKTIIILTHNK